MRSTWHLDAKRDWGYAMITSTPCGDAAAQEPDDFVIATGETHTVREFLELAFRLVDLDWQKYVKLDERYYAPTEVNLLLGDSSKAQRLLNWRPLTTFQELTRIMVEHDLELARQ
jgi:GDPmannose 4,6-dehydratase